MTRTFLTGGTGFIAAHILDKLLEADHSVVTSVRSHEKGQWILKNHPGVSKDKLSYAIVEDIAKEGAFDEAIKSDPPFDTVIHASSPFHFNTNDSKKDLLDPAIIGTTGILKAIKRSAPTVKRVVITSSFASIIDGSKGMRPGYVYSEKDWNPVTEDEAVQNASLGYRASKTFAERAAWDFVEKEKPNFTLATMCPPLVLGPIIHHLQSLDSLNTSNQRVYNIMSGKAKEELPPTGTFLWIDVRDLAFAHVRAASMEEAQNKRFFITAGYFSNEEIADIIRDNFPERKEKLPAKGVKGGGYPEDGLYKYDNSRTKKVLGIEFKSLKESIVDTVKSLEAAGA
ncbi:uncharacterized protein KY384_005411 [Bacidia gigantensis]|uniref:uncharacterized protein n=1 Tax=Bacidia gigantensis TaxID=2732470 RepID=UPI001D0471AA|nr:uncharacterized protein KY384_005411 [Bacidia gigantensis]KAG8529930.1 hypothetical protein KY384_005411 [Bacidia gigantensis]